MNDTYLYHIFFMLQWQIFIPWFFFFFIFISDKYVSHFFMYLRKILHLYFFTFISDKYLARIFFLCINDKYLSRVYFIHQWEPFVLWFLYQWWFLVFCFFYVSMTNICPVFLYSSMTTICHVILVSMMNICDVLLLIFSLNKLLSCAFLKHIFKANYLFHSFLCQEQIFVLYFLCINDKHFSRVFSIFQRKIFISYFLCITDKYFISWFCFSYLFVINTYLIFLFIIEKCNPSMFFIFINGKYLSCGFLCINDKYLSRVFLFVNENYLSCVFVPMMNICVLFF